MNLVNVTIKATIYDVLYKYYSRQVETQKTTMEVQSQHWWPRICEYLQVHIQKTASSYGELRPQAKAGQGRVLERVQGLPVSNKECVVVERVVCGSHQGRHKFMAEVMIIRTTRHANPGEAARVILQLSYKKCFYYLFIINMCCPEKSLSINNMNMFCDICKLVWSWPGVNKSFPSFL